MQAFTRRTAAFVQLNMIMIMIMQSISWPLLDYWLQETDDHDHDHDALLQQPRDQCG